MQDQVRTLAGPIAERLGLELVEVEYLREGGRSILRLTIDKPEGITHADCQALSGEVGTELDRLDLIPAQYYLEVSSPGLERPLRRDADFARFVGRLAMVHTFAPHEGKREWRGILRGLQEGRVVLEVEGRGDVAIPFDQVSRARLVFDPGQVNRGGKSRER